MDEMRGGDWKNMNAESISVDLRIVEKVGSKVKAFANVVLPLGEEGAVTLLGFSLIEAAHGEMWVASPSRKSGERYFDTLVLIGRVRALINEAVLNEYNRVLRTRRVVQERSNAE
jgi:DNA-binding cell septation regulator SpoVG